MSRHRVLAKNILLGAVGTLLLTLGAAKSHAQVVFDGLDWTTDRNGVVIDGNKNIAAQRSGYNGPTNGTIVNGAPNPALDPHRAILRWTFPFTGDVNGTTTFVTPATQPPTTVTNAPTTGAAVTSPATSIIVDNPYLNFDKSDTTIFTDSSQPLKFPTPVGPYTAGYGAKSLWLGPTFIIPDPTLRTADFPGFSFNFIPSLDPTDPNYATDPYKNNPSTAAVGDYGYALAIHNDFTVARTNGTSGPITQAEVGTFPFADADVYAAVHSQLVTEYNNAVANNASGHATAQWTIGQELNHNSDTHDPYDTTLPSNPLYDPNNIIPYPVPYDGEATPPYLPNNAANPTATARPLVFTNPPNPATAPNLRRVKYLVDIYTPGSGTAVARNGSTTIFDLHPNIQHAFVRVSWKNTINTDGTINAGSGVANAGGINDPANSRIFVVDLTQAGWIRLGPTNGSPSSFPNGGGADQVVVTMFSVTPDNVNDTTTYTYAPLVTADACRFTEDTTTGIPDPLNPPPVTPLGPLNDPLNPGTDFISAAGRFLGPVVGTNKLPVQTGVALNGATLWYCVREEVVNNQVRTALDPTKPISATNPAIIDASATATAPVFYCLTNDDDVAQFETVNTPRIYRPSKLRVRWRYVGYPDGGSATAFASPTIANVRGRDGNYHTIVYFCSTSNTELGGNAGRIYALDALGDQRATYDAMGNPLRTTQTTVYWTYPSVRPLEAAEVNLPNTSYAGAYHDPNYTNYKPDPLGLYPPDTGGNNPTPPAGQPTVGWWAPDQPVVTNGTQKYYDGDLIQSNNNVIVKTDTQIAMGGITGAPVVMDDPSNPTGPMILVVPSVDGRMYAFDAGGRGDFDNTKALPALPVDPNNPQLPPAALNLGYNYAIPGTTQRIWTWPHYGADAYHQIYGAAQIAANTPNTLQDEATTGSMPYSLAYDPTYPSATNLQLNPIVVSAGSAGEDGLPGVGHVYGILPLHDNRVTIGQNNTPTWNVKVQSAFAGGTTDRRYFAYPHVGTRVSDASATPLLDIPGVPTVFKPTLSPNVRYIYFTSQGRVYSIQMPNAAPNGGVYTAALNWAFPHSPNLPYQDSTDATSAELEQGFAPKGVAVLPAAVAYPTGITLPPGNHAVDTCYALLNNGTLYALDADPQAAGTRPAGATDLQTFVESSGTSGIGAFTEAAPTLTTIVTAQGLGGIIVTGANADVAPPPSTPALLFSDDDGGIYAIQTYPQLYTSDNSVRLPRIFEQTDTAGQIITPPALAGSTVTATPPISGIDPTTGRQLAAQPNYGGYFVVGDTYGQLLAFSLGRFNNGFGGTTEPGRLTDNGSGEVSIDVRELDAYRVKDYNLMVPDRGKALGSGSTPARAEGGGAYGNTATPIASNLGTTGLAVDQGGNLYLAASGVYHAQTSDPAQDSHGGFPSIVVEFTISQPNARSEIRRVTLTPDLLLSETNSPYKNGAVPGDRALTLAEMDALHIYGVDDNAPPGSQGPNITGDGPSAAQLTGTAQNVFPWAAKTLIKIIPSTVAGGSTYAPLTSGYTVTVKATITQTVQHKGGNPTTASVYDMLQLGQRNSLGKSQSAYGPNPNDPGNTSNFQSPARSLYITNPLALSVRGVPGGAVTNGTDQTGGSNPNIIGWAGPVDSVAFQAPGKINDPYELVGNGEYVGIAAAQTNAGYIKSLFAPFGMGQDNATATYQAVDNSGGKGPGVFVMDRSDLARATGQPVRVRAHVNSLHWNGTVASVMNPLPFDNLPDDANNPNTPDYPSLDARNVRFSINNSDATQAVATLLAPTNTDYQTVGTANADPSIRVPQPTEADMLAQVPKYFPANVNRGRTTFPYRGKNITIGGGFTDRGGNLLGSDVINHAIIGPLQINTGTPVAIPQATPSGGYVGSISVVVVPNNNTATTAANALGRRGGPTTFGGNAGTNQVNRLFETGLSVAPSFRMRVLESTLDMGNVPHGTGYSDLVGGNFLFRYPFAPSGMAPYITPANGTNPPQIGYSPWDSDNQLAAPTAANIGIGVGNPNSTPQFGRFFRPFTFINDSNVNLTHLRVAKLIGPASGDTSATPNMSGVIQDASLSLFAGTGIARSLRLNSDQVNDFLAPPLLATPFGQQATGGGGTGMLGNIGVVSSFDHASYAQSRISEVNLYPIFNPAMEDGNGNAAYQQAKDLFSMGLIDQDVYAQGGALQWQVNTQPRPTVHKPRQGDSTGTIATIPDQPYDFKNGTQNAYTLNNPGSGVNNVYQQQQQAGLYTRPSVAVAVPLGTPVGTYSTTIYPYEDGLPVQWLEWLKAANNNTPNTLLGNDDDILNTSNAGLPQEPFANPGATLKVAVRETRLTEGATPGSLPQIDVPSAGVDNPVGFNLQPTALLLPTTQIGSNYYNRLMLYWTTNRQVATGQNSGGYRNGLFPTATAPLNVAVSGLNLPYVRSTYLNPNIGVPITITRPDAQFQLFGLGGTDTNGNGLPSWWGIGANRPLGLLPGFDAGGLPDQYQSLFPVQAGQGAINPASVKYGSPASTVATNYDVATGAVNTFDPESYLVMQGTADLVRTGNAAGASLAQTQTRTFIASLNNYSGSSVLGLPDFGQAGATDGFLSFLNDPNVPKLSPRPLLVKLHNMQVTGGSAADTKFLYVFWHSGAQGRTSLYYNVNVQGNGLQTQFAATGFQRLGDQKLPTPGALTWQSDPYPVYRRVYDPTTNQMVDAVEVAFTGVLKNRQTVEVLLARYRIVEQATAATGSQPALAVGQLVPVPFPTVHQETLTRIPATNTYAARDAAWFIPNDSASQSSDTAVNRYMRVFYQKNGTSGLYLLNGLTGAANAQRGRVDPASGLVYFNATATDNAGAIVKDAGGRTVFGGGQMVVDSRSGTVSFPSIPPGKNDYILASYTPYLMRINTSRDETNAERDPSDLGAAVTSNNGAFGQLIAARPALVSPGQNYSPTYVMDRAPNTRGLLQSPQVLFNANSSLAGVGAVFPIDRMWMLYRKSDPSGALKSTVYLKAMRLTARLPYPVALAAVSGTQQIANLTVTGITRPLQKGYEVDYVRGRVYFQEEDEGTVVQINYTFYNPANPNAAPQQSGSLLYRVAWSDEISATGNATGDQTTYEVQMPTTSVVNEGQVAAFKDPFVDKLWIFWSSTRAGTVVNGNQQVGSTDLYYETLAPQFYPSASGQY